MSEDVKQFLHELVNEKIRQARLNVRFRPSERRSLIDACNSVKKELDEVNNE